MLVDPLYKKPGSVSNWSCYRGRVDWGLQTKLVPCGSSPHFRKSMQSAVNLALWIYSHVPMNFGVICSIHFKLSGIGMQQMIRLLSSKVHNTWSRHNFFLVQFAIKPKSLHTCYTCGLIKSCALILHITIDWVSKRNISSHVSITKNSAYNCFVSPKTGDPPWVLWSAHPPTNRSG